MFDSSFDPIQEEDVFFIVGEVWVHTTVSRITAEHLWYPVADQVGISLTVFLLIFFVFSPSFNRIVVSEWLKIFLQLLISLISMFHQIFMDNLQLDF